MKKFRNTFILIAVAFGLWLYLRYFDHRYDGTLDVPRLTAVDRATVKSFSIKNSEGTIAFRLSEEGWLIDSPVKDRADEGTVATLFTTLEGLDMNLRKIAPSKTKKPKELQKELGISSGEVSLKLGGSKPLELLIGKDTAVEGKVYARIDGGETTYVMPSELRSQLAKGVKDWRDRKLTSVTTGEVTKVVLKTAKGEMEAVRKNANWMLVRPLKARADNQKLSDLIASVTAPRVEDFISDTKDLGSFGLTEPRATVTLHIEGGREPVVLQIGGIKQAPKVEKTEEKEGADAAKKEPSVYVKASTREGVVTIPAAIENLILTQPNDLRDTTLIRVQQDMVDRITLEGGGSKIIIGRSGEDWKRKIPGKPDEAINSTAANKLLNDLTNARSVRFVEDVGSDLKRYGLDHPSAIATLSSYSTEGTPEESPGEKPIARVLFGREENGIVFTKLDDEPFIVAVNKSLTDELWSDPLQWQDVRIYELNKADIVKLEITRGDKPPVSLALDKEKGWKLSKGDSVVSQAPVQSVVNTLSALRAVRWAGKTKAAEQGLDKPSITIDFTLSNGTKGKLSIGSANSDLLRHAIADGKTGTFLLSKPDVSAFEAPLIEGEKAAEKPNENATAVPSIKPIEPITPPVVVPAKVQEAPASEAKPAPESAPK